MKSAACRLRRSPCAGVLQTTKIGTPPKVNSHSGSSGSVGSSAGHGLLSLSAR